MLSSGPTAESNSCAAGEADIPVFHPVPSSTEFSRFHMSPFVAIRLPFQAGRSRFQH